MAPAVLKSPARRAALRGLAAAGSAGLLAGLTGCGFALRQAPKFAFESVQVAGFENTSVSRSLQQALVSSGLRVVNSSAGAQAPVDPAQAAVPPQVLAEVESFTAARRDHLEKTIRPALARGEIVITDRFADSTRIFQGITRGDLRASVDALREATTANALAALPRLAALPAAAA